MKRLFPELSGGLWVTTPAVEGESQLGLYPKAKGNAYQRRLMIQ
jgi:hypothetical protein